MHLHGWIGHVCLSLDSTTLAYHFLELDGPFWVSLGYIHFLGAGLVIQA
jgi:hypothetical protein